MKHLPSENVGISSPRVTLRCSGAVKLRVAQTLKFSPSVTKVSLEAREMIVPIIIHIAIGKK